MKWVPLYGKDVMDPAVSYLDPFSFAPYSDPCDQAVLFSGGIACDFKTDDPDKTFVADMDHILLLRSGGPGAVDNYASVVIVSENDRFFGGRA
jgi:hypothetical protein